MTTRGHHLIRQVNNQADFASAENSRVRGGNHGTVNTESWQVRPSTGERGGENGLNIGGFAARDAIDRDSENSHRPSSMRGLGIGRISTSSGSRSRAGESSSSSSSNYYGDPSASFNFGGTGYDPMNYGDDCPDSGDEEQSYFGNGGEEPYDHMRLDNATEVRLNRLSSLIYEAQPVPPSQILRPFPASEIRNPLRQQQQQHLVNSTISSSSSTTPTSPRPSTTRVTLRRVIPRTIIPPSENEDSDGDPSLDAVNTPPQSPAPGFRTVASVVYENNNDDGDDEEQPLPKRQRTAPTIRENSGSPQIIPRRANRPTTAATTIYQQQQRPSPQPSPRARPRTAAPTANSDRGPPSQAAAAAVPTGTRGNANILNNVLNTLVHQQTPYGGTIVARNTNEFLEDAEIYFGRPKTSVKECKGCDVELTSQATNDLQPEMASVMLKFTEGWGHSHIFKQCEKTAEYFNNVIIPIYNFRLSQRKNSGTGENNGANRILDELTSVSEVFSDEAYIDDLIRSVASVTDAFVITTDINGVPVPSTAGAANGRAATEEEVEALFDDTNPELVVAERMEQLVRKLMDSTQKPLTEWHPRSVFDHMIYHQNVPLLNEFLLKDRIKDFYMIMENILFIKVPGPNGIPAKEVHHKNVALYNGLVNLYLRLNDRMAKVSNTGAQVNSSIVQAANPNSIVSQTWSTAFVKKRSVADLYRGS